MSQVARKRTPTYAPPCVYILKLFPKSISWLIQFILSVLPIRTRKLIEFTRRKSLCNSFSVSFIFGRQEAHQAKRISLNLKFRWPERSWFKAFHCPNALIYFSKSVTVITRGETPLVRSPRYTVECWVRAEETTLFKNGYLFLVVPGYIGVVTWRQKWVVLDNSGPNQGRLSIYTCWMDFSQILIVTTRWGISWCTVHCYLWQKLVYIF